MTKDHFCLNTGCNSITAKNRWGNYSTYCSDYCRAQGRREKFKKTYKNKDTSLILTRRKKTLQEKYGVDNASHIPEVKARLKITTKETANQRLEKTKENNIRRYGVESTNSLDSVKTKKKNTLLSRYGVDHQLKIPAVAAKVSLKNSENAEQRLSKASITNLEKYGCENPSSNQEVKSRRTATMIERFGVENASQNVEIHKKQSRSLAYEYIFPSGNSVKVQGYEGRALDCLLKIFKEEDIVIGKNKMPEIWYKIDNRNHRYFPDIYIPKENLIIEVKCEWTYKKDLDTLSKNISKRDGTISLGYKHHFMIFDNTGKNLLTDLKW